MKLILQLSLILFISFSLSFGRSFRVNQVPNGSKFSCNTCHTNGGGTPRNDFGLAVQAITGSANVMFWGPELAALDSDGDGFSNGIELQDPNGEWTPGSPAPGDVSLVTRPGDATDFPAVTSLEDFAELPNRFELGNNYPNPFNPSTTIHFSIAENTNVILEVFNSLGERVSTITNDFYTPGQYTVNWNSTDDFGRQVNSGIYYYRIVANNFTETKRMILLK